MHHFGFCEVACWHIHVGFRSVLTKFSMHYRKAHKPRPRVQGVSRSHMATGKFKSRNDNEASRNIVWLYAIVRRLSLCNSNKISFVNPGRSTIWFYLDASTVRIHAPKCTIDIRWSTVLAASCKFDSLAMVRSSSIFAALVSLAYYLPCNTFANIIRRCTLAPVSNLRSDAFLHDGQAWARWRSICIISPIPTAVKLSEIFPERFTTRKSPR